MIFWSDESSVKTSYGERALAAAAKVRWLAARRNAIHRANQVIRDAIDGTSDPQSFDNYQE
jgi:hypothetical protein